MLSVRDQGRGMGGDEQRRMFEPFQSRSPMGTGLGLAIVYQIVREHRGDISVRSVPRRGTEVIVHFPPWRSPGRGPPSLRARPRGPTARRAALKRVLVVDDEQSMREVLSIMLTKEGYEVVAADSRAQAAAVLAKAPADLVITDIRLPDGDGIEILRHVKAASPETAVVVMTAYGTTETAVAALKLGAHDYLTKPFDVDELKIVVRGALEAQRLTEENRRLKAELRSRHGLDRIIGVSRAMASVFELVRSVATTSSTVLITGESGTGKELVARPSTPSPRGGTRPSSRSTAGPCRRRSWRASCSAT